MAVILVTLISAYMGWSLTHPEKASIKTLSPNVAPEYKDVSFKGKNKNIVLNGWFFKAKGSSRTVILAHEHSKNRLQFGDQTLNMIKDLISNGYNVLAFDFRNSGKSSGKISSLGFHEKDDLLAAVSYAKSQGSKHIVLIGFSTGAAASILAAAESKDIDAVIADSSYLSLKEYIKYNILSARSRLPGFPFNTTVTLSVELLAAIDADDANPAKAMNSISPRPVLFIHSRDDPLIPVDNSRELYSMYSKAGSGNPELWETEGAGHAGSYEKFPQQYMERVLSFLNKIYGKR